MGFLYRLDKGRIQKVLRKGHMDYGGSQCIDLGSLNSVRRAHSGGRWMSKVGKMSRIDEMLR